MLTKQQLEIRYAKYNRKIVQLQANIDTPNTHIHDRSLSLLGTDSSIKSGRVKQVL
jgi:hypothetical protein